ncbi:MAG TPA: hypothetical protein VFA11_12195 [Acidimicrobiales bacterium]|nr:hypothetical protein [Acidimicrobiales bacterium]
MRCEEVAELLPDVLEGGAGAPARAVRHVETCLRCQAELAQYRRLLRALRQLRFQLPEPPAGLLSSLLGGVEASAERHALRAALLRRRVAYAAALAVAGAAGAAGAAVLAGRSRDRIRLAG